MIVILHHISLQMTQGLLEGLFRSSETLTIVETTTRSWTGPEFHFRGGESVKFLHKLENHYSNVGQYTTLPSLFAHRLHNVAIGPFDYLGKVAAIPYRPAINYYPPFSTMSCLV